VGLASGLVTRDALEARSLDDAIERITVAGQGSGVSANMGILRDPHRQVRPDVKHYGPIQRMRGPVMHGCVLQEVGFGVGSMDIPDGDCLWRIVWPDVKHYGPIFVAPYKVRA
jgi:hypothetical protein